MSVFYEIQESKPSPRLQVQYGILFLVPEFLYY